MNGAFLKRTDRPFDRGGSRGLAPFRNYRPRCAGSGNVCAVLSRGKHFEWAMFESRARMQELRLNQLAQDCV
jgi:hypothetical protein